MELQHRVLKEAKEKNPDLSIGDEEKLIPQTSDRLMSDFTVDERRVMYDYVIAHTVAPDVGKDITLDNAEKKEEKNTTILELLQQERNLKRRRAKYRGVHTNKKTHTEILREVVEQQMEMYKEYVAEKFGVSLPEDQKSSCSDSSKYKKQELKKNETDCDEYSTFSRSRNYEFSNDRSKFDTKDCHDKHNKNFKHHYDTNHRSHKSSHYKDDSYENSFKDRDLGYSQKGSNRRESSHWGREKKHDFQEHKWDKRDDYSKNEDKSNNSRSRRKSRSRSKERKRSRSKERRTSGKSKKSSSKERNRDEKKKDVSRERKNHKKHKKEHKKKRDRSNDGHNTESRKHSKRRSRSLS